MRERGVVDLGSKGTRCLSLFVTDAAQIECHALRQNMQNPIQPGRNDWAWWGHPRPGIPSHLLKSPDSLVRPHLDQASPCRKTSQPRPTMISCSEMADQQCFMRPLRNKATNPMQPVIAAHDETTHPMRPILTSCDPEMSSLSAAQAPDTLLPSASMSSAVACMLDGVS